MNSNADLLAQILARELPASHFNLRENEDYPEQHDLSAEAEIAII